MKRLFALVLMMFVLVGCSSEPQHLLSYTDGKRMEVCDIDCVAVFTDYTNKSSESAIPADYLSVKAYQNGVEIPCLVPTGERTEGHIQCDASVQSGVTAQVVWIFQLDDDSVVTVEMPDGIKVDIE